MKSIDRKYCPVSTEDDEIWENEGFVTDTPSSSVQSMGNGYIRLILVLDRCLCEPFGFEGLGCESYSLYVRKITVRSPRRSGYLGKTI